MVRAQRSSRGSRSTSSRAHPSRSTRSRTHSRCKTAPPTARRSCARAWRTGGSAAGWTDTSAGISRCSSSIRVTRPRRSQRSTASNCQPRRSTRAAVRTRRTCSGGSSSRASVRARAGKRSRRPGSATCSRVTGASSTCSPALRCSARGAATKPARSRASSCSRPTRTAWCPPFSLALAALDALGRGAYAEASRGLAKALPRLGGSLPQRELLALTQRVADERRATERAAVPAAA